MIPKKINIFFLRAILTAALCAGIGPTFAQTTRMLYTDSTGNNIGIGTTTPQAAFVVTNGNVGIGTWTADGGRLIVSGGNVGIGSAAPGAALDVNGNIRATASAGSLSLGAKDNAGAFLYFLGGSSLLNWRIDHLSLGNGLSFASSTTNGGTTFTTATAAMTLLGTNVGIGTQMSPGTKLDIMGDWTGNSALPSANSNVDYGITIGNGSAASAYPTNRYSGITFAVNAGASPHQYDYAGIYGYSTGTVSGAAGGMVFGVKTSTNSNTAMTAAMIINDNGHVGIGSGAATNKMLNILAPDDVYAAEFKGSSTTGKSYGPRVEAGTNSSDVSFIVNNHNNTLTHFYVYGDGGVVIGNAPTGGDKGMGTINVDADIYKDGTAYTNPDYVFEKYFTGNIMKFKDNLGASTYTGLKPLADVMKFAGQYHELPLVHSALGGIFGKGDGVLASLEEAYLYIFDMDKRLQDLQKDNAGLRQRLEALEKEKERRN